MVDIHLNFQLDNMTAVTYINHMGGSKSIACDKVAKKIWNWCIPRNIWLSATHIPGCTNVIADSLSRKHRYSDHEWKLNPDLFQSLSDLFPNLSIDLFATMINTQLPRYASWRPDPHAVFIDAFSVSWRNDYFYAFPPFRPNPQMRGQDRGRACRGSSGRPSLGQPDMVHTSVTDVNSTAQTPDLDSRNGATDSPVRQQSPQHEGQTKIDGMSFIRGHYQKQGFPEHITGVLLDSWRPATQK